MSVLKVWVGCVVLACTVAPLSGEWRSFSGGGDHRPYPSLELPWERPPVGALPAGKALWESTSFYVDETGLYDFRHFIDYRSSDPGPYEFPRVLFLYAQEFDPAQPQKNLLGTLDLSDGREAAEVSWALLAHTMYHLVLSTVGESKPLDSEGNNLRVETVLEGPGKILQSSCRFTDDIDNDADNLFWADEASFVSLRSEGFEQVCAGVQWWDDGSETINFARVSPLRTEDSALFYFFDPQNWEINLKVLDGCAINGHYWVLASSSTDVRFKIEMRWLGKELFPDEESPYFVPSFGGSSLAYEHPGGGPASAFIDVLAFHCDRPF